jgi:hypothetical protein
LPSQVVSAKTALPEETIGEPIKVHETIIKEEVVIAPPPAPESAPEKAKGAEESIPAVSEAAVAPEPEAPLEVETKEVVEEAKVVTDVPTVEKIEEEAPKETPEEEAPKETPEPTVEETKEATDSGEALIKSALILKA